MKKAKSNMEDDLRPEDDFAQMPGGAKGKYVERYRAGTNLVRLDPDVAQAFLDAAAVNGALRLLMQIMPIAQRQQLNAAAPQPE